MNSTYVNELAEKTIGVRVGTTSWKSVVKVLADAGFNRWEAEAILNSNIVSDARKAFVFTKDTQRAVSSCLSGYLEVNGIKPQCKLVNELVMARFGKELALELNEEGIPCERGNPPGNPTASILVPLGTPHCCNPLHEAYWCQ